MPPALAVRRDFSAETIAGMAEQASDPGYARRLRAMAAILRGASRDEAASIGRMERQTLRDWVERFNEGGPEGLSRKKPSGRPAKLTPGQRKMLAEVVLAGPASSPHELARWRLCDLASLVSQRFGVELDEVSIGRTLRGLGFKYTGSEWRQQDNR
jgi:transposase